MRRVVVTGMGIYSCIGQDLDTVRDSLMTGKSGIIVDPVREQMGFRSYLTGFLPEPNLNSMLDRRKRVCMSQEASYAYLATLSALEQAKIDNEFLAKQ